MKKALAILLLFGCLISQAQVESTINLPYRGSTTHALLYQPGHATGKKYPLIMFFHGSGEAGTNLASIYNSTTAGGPAYLIEHGLWNIGIANWQTGQLDSAIVICPQTNNSWSASGDDIDGFLTYIKANYAVDPNRISLTGLSAGGGGCIEFAAHLDINEDDPTGANDHVRVNKIAAMVPMSAATNTPKQLWMNKMGADSIKVWGHGDPNNDTYGEYTQDDINFLNIALAGYGIFTANTYGHGGWNNIYNPNFRQTIAGHSVNIYEWMMVQTSSGSGGATPSSPTASAGTAHTVIQPSASAILVGTVTAGNTHTTASGFPTWTQVSGPTTATISPSSGNSTTTVSALAIGVYTFRLTETNEASQTATSDVTVTVIANSYLSPTITNSGNQTITLPTSAVSVTSTPVFNGASLSSNAWTKLGAPGYSKIKIVFLGSSYPSGGGASVEDSSGFGGYDTANVLHHGLFWSYCQANGLSDSVIMLTNYGTNVYQAMPTGYVPISDVNAKESPNDTPHVKTNITAAIARNPNVIIGCWPTNEYQTLTMAEVMLAYHRIYDSATAHGILCLFTTTAPRTDATYSTQAQRNELKSVSDSLIAEFPGHTIDFYDALTFSGTTNPIPQYVAGVSDSIHMGNAGHRQMFNQMVGYNIFKGFITSASTITSPTAQNTTITGLVAGAHKFQSTVTDTHGSAASAFLTITVNSSGTATANAGSPQTITLPVSTVTLNGSGSSGATSYSWTYVSGPQPPTITTPTTVSTTVTGLVQGIYTFKLSINAGVSTSNVVITVGPVVPTPPCKGAVYIIPADPTDSSVYIPAGGPYKPGDTLRFNASAYSSVDLQGLIGSTGCPIVLISGASSQTLVTKRINLDGCQYVKVTGSGSNNQYGFLIQQDPQLRQQSFSAIDIFDKSRNIEVERVYMHNVDIGIVCESNEDCDTTLDYPNWVIDSCSFHDNRIVGTWNEGMYIGNTSPDNASYDLRPVVCGGITYYYAPMKNGYVHVYNNVVDSTGRGGIQLANAASGLSEINNNTVKHTGLNGDDAQGTGIGLGLYTRANVHDNTVINTYTWGIASIGAGATNIPLIIKNNTIDSTGSLKVYNLAVTSRIVYDPRTEPSFSGTLTWQPQPIEIDTRQRLYTTDVPHAGTAVHGTDSTKIDIEGNNIGKQTGTIDINVDDDYTGMQKNGNIICGNLRKVGGVATVQVVAGINYSAICSVVGPINYHPIRRGSKLKIITKP